MYFQQQNPYAPPQAYDPNYGGYGYGYGQMGWDQPLASRGARFGARLVDGLLALATVVPGLIWLFSAMDSANSARYSSTYDPYASSYSSGPNFEDLAGPIALMVIPMLALTIYQWVMTAKHGQTLGKKWLKIKVVKHDGSPVDFVSGVILREWVQGFLNNLPWVGGIIGLIDACMIFSQDQQCMHDKIAKTKVIAVMPGEAGF